jgi:hypothetical protein
MSKIEILDNIINDRLVKNEIEKNKLIENIEKHLLKVKNELYEKLKNKINHNPQETFNTKLINENCKLTNDYDLILNFYKGLSIKKVSTDKIIEDILLNEMKRKKTNTNSDLEQKEKYKNLIKKKILINELIKNEQENSKNINIEKYNILNTMKTPLFNKRLQELREIKKQYELIKN